MNYAFCGFISFYETVEKVFNKARFPAFSCRKSKRLYSQFVHVFFHVLKELYGLSYRELIAFAEEHHLERLFCIRRIPQFSTFQKFLKRVNKELLERMVRACAKVLKIKKTIVAIDSTGFSLTNPSQYYSNRINAPRVRNFVKLSLAVDVKTKIILNCKAHANNQHDNMDFHPLLKDLRKLVKSVLADKAYDSEENLRFVLKDLKASVQIPVRDYPNSRLKYGHKPIIGGKLRRKMHSTLDLDKYHQRSIIEAINSSIKRTLGASVQARLPNTQENNAILKALTYNIKKIKNKLYITIHIKT